MIHFHSSGLWLLTKLQDRVQSRLWVCAEGGSWMGAQSQSCGNSTRLHTAGRGYGVGEELDYWFVFYLVRPFCLPK